jgi:hypothetical protein
MFLKDVFVENLKEGGLNLALLEGEKNACFCGQVFVSI